MSLKTNLEAVAQKMYGQSIKELDKIKEQMQEVIVSEPIVDYILDVIETTALRI